MSTMFLVYGNPVQGIAGDYRIVGHHGQHIWPSLLHSGKNVPGPILYVHV